MNGRVGANLGPRQAGEGKSLLELRPMGVVELVDGALEICARHFLTLVAIVFPGYLLLGAGLMLLASFAELTPPQYTGGFQFYLVGGGIVSLLLFLSYISHGAGVYYLYRAETGLQVNPGEAFGRAMRYRGSLILVAAVAYMAAGAGAFLFVIPGIAIYSFFALCVPVVMVENIGYMRAIKRGYRMQREFFGRAFKVYMLFAALWFVLLLTLHAMIHLGLVIARSFFDIEVGLLSNAFSMQNFTYLTFLNVLILLGAGCVMCGLAVLLYIDVRVRTEGIDIERRIGSLPPLEGEKA